LAASFVCPHAGLPSLVCPDCSDPGVVNAFAWGIPTTNVVAIIVVVIITMAHKLKVHVLPFLLVCSLGTDYNNVVVHDGDLSIIDPLANLLLVRYS
jgi:hypothetical protein